MERTDDEEGKKNIPFQLQRLFLNLQTSSKKSIQTHDLTKSFGWNSDDGMMVLIGFPFEMNFKMCVFS